MSKLNLLQKIARLNSKEKNNQPKNKKSKKPVSKKEKWFILLLESVLLLWF